MELAAASEPKPGLLSRALSRAWRWLRPPRRVRPTKAGWAFLGILWAIFFAALNSGNNLLYLILALLFALISVSGLFSEYSIRPVRLTLEFPRAVTAGEPLYVIHAEFPADFNFAREAAAEDPGYQLGPGDERGRQQSGRVSDDDLQG